MSTVPARPLQIVVMGVSGTGKSSVGKMLSERLGVAFHEGDDLHPEQNIAKMAAGVPLTDEDREPWLRRLAEVIAASEAAATSSVVTCSALRRRYRDLLRSKVPDEAVFFVHLHAGVDVLRERMDKRDKHFMPASLLQSQLDTLEPLQPDEPGVVLDVAAPLEVVAEGAAEAVLARHGRPRG